MKPSRIILVTLLVALLAACSLPAPSPATLIARITEPGGLAPPAAGDEDGALSATETPEAVPTSLPTPTPSDEDPILFAVIGDYGQDGRHAFGVAEMIDTWEVDFIVTTGDNNYQDGAAETIDVNIGQYYHRYIGNYKGDYFGGSAENRFFPSLGNHDWALENIDPYLDYFTLPGNERYYDVEWPPVHIFILDSDPHEPDGVGRSSDQAAWLEEALEASDAAWQIVVMHHPPYSSAHHGSTDWMQWPFADWGVDLVLSGHDHVYERLEVDGLLYITNGLGGHGAIYEFPNILPESQLRYNEDYGAMRVEVTEAWIRLEFINVVGDVIDIVTLLAE
jgi:hypothetical protein